MTPDPASARSELAPRGVLRVALNDANFLLVRRTPGAIGVGGLAPALAREIGLRLDARVEFVHYPDAGLMASAVGTGAWNVGFLGIDSTRGHIAFTEAYVEIDAGYLVPAGSALRSTDDVDRPGVRVAVAARSAYDLFLTRALTKASILRAETIDGSRDLFVHEGLEVLAGLKPRLIEESQRLRGSRVLEGRFTAIQQGIGTPADRTSGAAYLRAFVREAKRSGLVAELIVRHGIPGISIPQP
jgi:polar amino acid transport system substrate-binding protein